MMVRYEQDLDAAALERARASLRSWGYLTTPEEIIANTEMRIREDFNERFPMLMFFLIISSFSMISSVIVTPDEDVPQQRGVLSVRFDGAAMFFVFRHTWRPLSGFWRCLRIWGGLPIII